MASALEIKMAFEAGRAGLPFKGGDDPELSQAYSQGLAAREQSRNAERARQPNFGQGHEERVKWKREQQKRERRESDERRRRDEEEAERERKSYQDYLHTLPIETQRERAREEQEMRARLESEGREIKARRYAELDAQMRREQRERSGGGLFWLSVFSFLAGGFFACGGVSQVGLLCFGIGALFLIMYWKR